MVGNRIRKRRQQLGLSLDTVAREVDVSTATLSRVETGKQGLSLELFVRISETLRCPPGSFLEEEQDDDGATPLADHISSLDSPDRARVWKRMAASSIATRSRQQHQHVQDLSMKAEELMAQTEYLYGELGSLQAMIESARTARQLRREARTRKLTGAG